MENDDFTLKRSQKNSKKSDDFKQVLKENSDKVKTTLQKEPKINESKLKKIIATLVIGALILIGLFVMFLQSGNKKEMFYALNKSKSEVVREFKDKYNKNLSDDNFIYEDGGNKSKLNTVFKQDPTFGSKFDENMDLSQIHFTINGNDPKEDKEVETNNTENKDSENQTENNKNFIVKNYIRSDISEVILELKNNNIKYEIDYELTRNSSLEGLVSKQSINSGSVILKDSMIVLTIYTTNIDDAKEKYEKNSDTKSDFDEKDPSNPNVKKDKSIIWSWKQGDKVDFRSYSGDVPKSCYSNICYYDGSGKPTTKTLDEQLNR